MRRNAPPTSGCDVIAFPRFERREAEVKSYATMLTAMALFAPGLMAQQMDIQDYVRQTFIQGVPYQQSAEYGASDVPTLLSMLADPAEEMWWTNIVGVLGIIGDERAVQPLIDFAEASVDGETSPAVYRAKTAVPMALGYLVNRSGSQAAQDYLIESLDPDAWNRRGVGWTDPFLPTAEERNVQLTTMAAMGLALSGTPEAAAALRTMADTMSPTLTAQMGDAVSDALEVHEQVSEMGLAEYYRRIRGPSGP